MKLTFVNVGYGEAILLECPDPAYENGTFVMLIDGGGARADEFADRSSGRIPLVEYLREKGLDHIDLMVSSHPHEDHICGLVQAAELLMPAALWQMLPVGLAEPMTLLDADSGQTSSEKLFMQGLNAHKKLCTMLAANGSTVSAVYTGESGQLCDGLSYQVLAPSAEKSAELGDALCRLYEASGKEFFRQLNALDSRMNNSSLILALNYQGKKILLPGDTNAMGYREIDPADLHADLFKVGHHGQLDGADQKLLDAVQPKAVVCCASSDRRYNSAHPDVVDLMRQNGAEVYFSDCPELPGLELTPHRAVSFMVGDGGAFSAEYII